MATTPHPHPTRTRRVIPSSRGRRRRPPRPTIEAATGPAGDTDAGPPDAGPPGAGDPDEEDRPPAMMPAASFFRQMIHAARKCFRRPIGIGRRRKHFHRARIIPPAEQTAAAEFPEGGWEGWEGAY